MNVRIVAVGYGEQIVSGTVVGVFGDANGVGWAVIHDGPHPSTIMRAVAGFGQVDDEMVYLGGYWAQGGGAPTAVYRKRWGGE